MYRCKCGIEIDLTRDQWSKIAKNYRQYQKESVNCQCGDTLHVHVEPDPCEDAWYVSHLEFESDNTITYHGKEVGDMDEKEISQDEKKINRILNFEGDEHLNS